MSRHATRKRGWVPSYWWDFRHYPDGRMTLIIESDDDAHQVIKEYEMPPQGPADKEIDAAERLIADLRAGRRVHP